MRSKVAKKLRSVFEKCLRVTGPQFDREVGAEIPPGDRLFCWKMQEEFCAYLMLCLDPRRDRFTLDVAWSRKSRFPTYLLPMAPYDIPECQIRRDKPRDGEFRTRIGSLYPPHRDFWWKVSPGPDVGELSDAETMQYILHGDNREIDEMLIAEKVAEAIGKVRDYAIPYLQAASID